jgi:hypothetical protein
MFKPLTPISSLFIVLTAGSVSADFIDITLLSNPPYANNELSLYLPTVSTRSEPPVGFNGVNIGNGNGDGRDEVVGFSFIFQPITQIETAYLTIDLTPYGTSTDELLFADNNTVRGYGLPGAKYYGNTQLKALSRSVRTSITFDLKNLDYFESYRGVFGTEDLSLYLRDGDFSVVYADDAIIHSARLRIYTGLIELPPLLPPTPVQVPEPSTIMLLLTGCLPFLIVMIMKFMKRVGN